MAAVTAQRRAKTISYSLRCRHLVAQFLMLFLVGPGAAISQVPPGSSLSLCSSPLMVGGRVFLENIAEDTAVGTVIGNLQLAGGDQIGLAMKAPNDHVNFDPVTQNVEVISELDKETTNSIDIGVVCEMKGLGFELDIPIKVSILDINDNPPLFQGDPYTASMSELTPVGTTILSDIMATDLDSDNWKVTYEVLDTSPYSSHFGFTTESIGSLVLLQPIDYELVTVIELAIVVKDHHTPFVLGKPQPQLNSTTSVTVTVLDGDDQNPLFVGAPYMTSVVEDAPVGTTIEMLTPVMASDPDIGFNATIIYTLLDDPTLESSYFAMDPVTAVVTLQNDALRRGTQFVLQVRATQSDNPDRYATSTLRVLVQEVNENQPRFLRKIYSTSLVENVQVGTYVAALSAIDNDQDLPVDRDTLRTLKPGGTLSQGSVLLYSFAPSSLLSEFTINENTGEVRTATGLSYETRASYNITVQVTDGKYFDFAYLEVDLVNINNFNPTFKVDQYNFNAFRDTNFYVGQVTAEDPDVGSVITYRLVGDSSLFAINDAGEIRISGNPRDLTQAAYTLSVVAEDDGIPPRRDAAKVTVTFDSDPLGVVGDDQTSLVVIIILAVLAGCLLLIILVLAIYIYRNKVTVSEHNTYLASSDLDIASVFETSKSFERGLNSGTQVYNAYVHTNSDPEGLAYKPTGRDRHLALYNGVAVGENGTTVQESPFHPASSRDEATSPSVTSASLGSSGAHLYSQPRPRERRNSGGSYPGYGSDRTLDSEGDPALRDMSDLNRVEYDTAVSPMEAHYGRENYAQRLPTTQPPGHHPPSDYMDSANSLSTFKMGSSRQRLVGPDISPRSSASEDSQPELRKGSSVSFIDDHQVNVYHPDNAISPGSGVVHEDKPEITVYY